MIKLKAFSRLKNIFSRLNPIPSFKWDDSEEEIIVPPSSEELLVRTIKKYPKLNFAILFSIYHLINTQNETNEFLSVLTKDFRWVADLVEGNDIIVKTPIQVEIEGKNNNILIAVHNHFFGAIIPSLGDICQALENNCSLISIVSENHIGMVVIEHDASCDKNLVEEFTLFHGYLDLCFKFERNDELNKLRLLQINEDKKEKLKLEAYDKLFPTIRINLLMNLIFDSINLKYMKYI